jgi:hypothetical protein
LLTSRWRRRKRGGRGHVLSAGGENRSCCRGTVGMKAGKKVGWSTGRR